MLGKGIFGRALAGGLAGGIMSGDWGGAAGGAAVGAVGWGALNKLGGGLNVARDMGNQLGALGRGVRKGQSFLNKGAFDMTVGGAARGYAGMGLGAASRGLKSAQSFIGRNALATNRYAGYAMGAAGVGAGAYIGSSVLRSNRR